MVKIQMSLKSFCGRLKFDLYDPLINFKLSLTMRTLTTFEMFIVALNWACVNCYICKIAVKK